MNPLKIVVICRPIYDFFPEWKHNYKFRVIGCDCLPYSSVNIFNINLKNGCSPG
jgi:hypothetical protein